MKLIGAGFGRTGTMSLRAALDILGYGPCYHMIEVGMNRSHAPVWKAAAEGNPPDWREFLDGYQSTMDWPGCLFWKELADTFPDAKVVLNTRDPERWYDSVRGTFLHAYGDPSESGTPGEGNIPSGPDLPPEVLAEMAPMFEMMRSVMSRQFGSFEAIADKEVALETFRKHYETVQETIPADRLLVYEVKQGWEPLCAFLDVPVPDEEFPHLNDRANFAQTVTHYITGQH